MKLQRIQEIETYIHQHKNATLDELCATFNVSKNTIRRDLNELERYGAIKKVYGGVVSTESALISYENRYIHHQESKTAIGKLAAQLICENDLIFIDSGTTTSQILPFVDSNLAFTLLTNSLDVIDFAATMPHVQLISVGNTFKRKTRSFIGLENESLINHYNINKAFMAATGISANGITNSDMMEYQIKQLIVKKASATYLLADESKFNHAALLTYAPLDAPSKIITTEKIPKNYLDFFREHHIDVLF